MAVYRFTLSFREIELLMAARGMEVTYETDPHLVHEVRARMRPPRHRMTAADHRTEIIARFQVWDPVTEQPFAA